jgi:hypothetical protein
MGKRKTRKQSAKATLAEVIKEMAKPRVAMSAREQSHVLRSVPHPAPAQVVGLFKIGQLFKSPEAKIWGSEDQGGAVSTKRRADGASSSQFLNLLAVRFVSP